MKIEIRPIDSLIEYANNPRDNSRSIDKVAASIKEFGWQQPIVIDKEGVIVAGHTRYQAAKKLGLKEVPVKLADELTPGQVKAYRLADNKTNEFAEWDMPKLNIELEELKLDFNMPEFGFEPTPDFRPGIEDEQGELDEKQMTKCPSCGEIFDHSKNPARI